jgi:hypothetical protein
MNIPILTEIRHGLSVGKQEASVKKEREKAPAEWVKTWFYLAGSM